MGLSVEKSHGPDHFDVIVIGAGVSGINTAYRLQSELPDVTFAVLEGRDAIGGTWDLFKFPGVRSDSDMYSFGFAWNPWPYSQPVGKGHLIKEYLRSSIAKYQLDYHFHFKHKVVSMDWSSKAQQWDLTINHNDIMKHYTAGTVILGTGYYDYENPRPSIIPGLDDFKGKVIHPQFWPEDYDYTGKKMVIVGSGATAITLLPNLAKKAAKVTMVQRSPSYVASLPNRKISWLSASYLRLWYIFYSYTGAMLCLWFPNYMRKTFRKQTIKQLPDSVNVDLHFRPRYSPWEQRLCMSPDGDFFKAFHQPNTDIVTGIIKRVTEKTVEMENGQIIDADVIVTATGLTMQFGGKIDIKVDGELVKWNEKFIWNGTMLQDIPNFFFIAGYARAAWTLGADSCAFIIIRFLKLLSQQQATVGTPRIPEAAKFPPHKYFPLSSTYSMEAEARLPLYGNSGPWKRKRDSPPADLIHAHWGDITTDLQLSI
ncbi:FAD/NAD(P)-binding domain-containing protein [Hypoxylon trugodes]|uniref:FAD/NAD(P)-binding domain-containing protein n=1 Tax=Hypoxylon trugodes TaxID=326681 RepID=UPI00219E9115|nr:FAD/NAD(P)-binding domain-containing protein [Hypoxylon trugodes]KAI1387622.1 FAD/NAD(P)-binding domain-containing protein [Hypoxylon trugodes]